MTKITSVDCSTGISIDRDMTIEEEASHTAHKERTLLAKTTADTAESARLLLVESGDAKLRTAGLNQAEIDARRVRK
jgi:hypothetical protein